MLFISEIIDLLGAEWWKSMREIRWKLTRCIIWSLQKLSCQMNEQIKWMNNLIVWNYFVLFIEIFWRPCKTIKSCWWPAKMKCDLNWVHHGSSFNQNTFIKASNEHVNILYPVMGFGFCDANIINTRYRCSLTGSL